MKNLSKTMKLTILGLMTGVLLLMIHAPWISTGGPLVITFNMISVAVCAITRTGAVAGGVFGLTSFLQTQWNRRSSAMGVTFWHHVFGVCSEICPQSADRSFYRLAVFGNEKETNAAQRAPSLFLPLFSTPYCLWLPWYCFSEYGICAGVDGRVRMYCFFQFLYICGNSTPYWR